MTVFNTTTKSHYPKQHRLSSVTLVPYSKFKNLTPPYTHKCIRLNHNFVIRISTAKASFTHLITKHKQDIIKFQRAYNNIKA